MAWLRFDTAQTGWPNALRSIADIERRQALLKRTPLKAADPVPTGAGAKIRPWAAVKAEHSG